MEVTAIWVKQMPNIDDCELQIFRTYEAGKLKSVATKGELAKFKTATRAMAVMEWQRGCLRHGRHFERVRRHTLVGSRLIASSGV